MGSRMGSVMGSRMGSVMGSRMGSVMGSKMGSSSSQMSAIYADENLKVILDKKVSQI